MSVVRGPIFGLSLWLAYGIALRAAPIIAANAIGVLLDVVLIALKLRSAPHGPLVR